ncbi:MAG: helix-hairpin-helix domain-containing protein [Candidatus Hermodarchaeota archaeon]
MTDTQEGLLQKKSDLKFYYKMAQEAFQANDVDQALKISKSGLKQAKLQNNGDWVAKFDIFNSNVSQHNSLVPSIKKESLTIVSGIGVKVAEKLASIGINSISDLAESSARKIARINGIGLERAQNYINHAKKHVGLKNLNDFSDLNNSEDKIEVIEESSLKQESDKWFDEKFEKPETEKWYPSQGDTSESNIVDDNLGNYTDEDENFNDFIEDETEEDEVSNLNYFESDKEEKLNESEVIEESDLKDSLVISPELIRQSNLKTQEQDAVSKETLDPSQLQKYILETIKTLELSEFISIKNMPNLRRFFTGIDLLAIKLVQVKEFLELIYIIPIKISTLKGSLISSNNTIKYNSLKITSEKDFRLERLSQSYIKAISNSLKIINEDLLNQGSFFQFLSKYLKINISLEKSITHKNLFFHSGPVQYKILIEPLILCHSDVGFTEKLVPFAYQKRINLHILSQSQLQDFLHYIDQKYYLIETYSEQKNAIALNCEASNKFVEDLRKYSAPFMLYGFGFLLVLLFQWYSALPFLINLGYGVISLYLVVVAYIYLKLHNRKSELHLEFSTPYYQKKLNFDETNLILINEELSPRFMEQFVYECIGKDDKFNIVNKIEQKNAETFLRNKLNKKKIEESQLFESEDSAQSLETKDSQFKNKLVQKYSSFLED